MILRVFNCISTSFQLHYGLKTCEWAALRLAELSIARGPVLPKQKLHKQVIETQGCQLEVSFVVIQYCNDDEAFYNSEMASE